MKQRTVKIGILAIFIAIVAVIAIFANAPFYDGYALGADGNITCQNAGTLSADYMSTYQVPTSMFTCEANGGGSINNAFDGNWNSSWVSSKDNVNGFINRITVTFDREVSVNRIIYASDSTRSGYGYPTRLKIYSKNGEGAETLYGECVSNATASRVIFTFAEPITATGIVFEYANVNTAHKYVASAKEIQFLQPETESANDALRLFTDYTQHTVREEFTSQLDRIRENVKNLLNYESALKPLVDRADSVVRGEVERDDRFEFSTDPNSKNVIQRWGNLIGYAKDVLKVNVYGYTTNRQVTGIGGLTGTTVTVYVDAPNPKDPLPSIFFSQASGYWQNWKATYSLTRGKNVFTVPQFLVEPNGAGGGPIYIVNPYTKDQQSTDVKVYIEGGFLYPTYRVGDDEDAFKQQLKEYEENRLTDTAGIVDVCEIVGDLFINTTKSSNAYAHYITGNVSPKKNVESWIKYMTGMLAFDGITMNPDDEHFDERNLHIPVNFRIAHWSGYGAYAVSEHIGLVALGHGSLTNLVAPGWGLSHEFGHMLDLGERSRAETTNNMWAVYGDILMNNSINTGKAQHIVSPSVLYPDETATDYNYYHTNIYSISQWWNLEAMYPGFWGRLDNNYRYYDRNSAFIKAGVSTKDEQSKMTKTEIMVYFSSLATGVDLGYYYERYGFAFESAPFKVATASSAYTKLVAQAIKDGVLSTKQYKYWYFDINQYFHDVSERALYSPESKVEIVEVWQNANQYTLILPKPSDSDRHLGYEIKEYRDGNWYVIGFTRTESFIDATAYPEGYTPRYKISAYDRQLNCTQDSSEKTVAVFSQTNVCRIGETYYNSLKEAVESANAGETVYLCTDTQESGITLSKNIFILPDPALTGDVTIRRRSTSAVFTLSGGTLVLGAQNNPNAKIILDGFSFAQGSPLISINSSTLKLYNVILRNNTSTANGGAISVNVASGRLYITDCELSGNCGSHGGAIYNEGRTELLRCTISGNTASNNGGAIANFQGGIVVLNDCTVSNNKAKNGGGFAIDGSTVINNTEITGNSTQGWGGGLYIAISKSNRTVTIKGGTVGENIASKGNALYLHDGTLYLDGENGVSFVGEIFKNSGAIRVKTPAMDFSNVVFHLASIAENTVLLIADGAVKFADETLSNMRVYLGSAHLDDGKTNVLVNSAIAEITFTVGEQRINLDHTVGWMFTIPETVENMDIPADKEFDHWEIDGVRYDVGDNIVISEATEIRAVLRDKPIERPQKPAENDPDSEPSEPEKDVLPVGLIVGVSVGVVGGVAVIVAVTVIVLRVLNKKKKEQESKE